MALLEKLLDLLDLHVPVSLTESYVRDPENDFRTRIQPKYKGDSLLAEYGREQAYYQVFVNQDPGACHSRLERESRFIPNLSILDLLSAEGPDACRFL